MLREKLALAQRHVSVGEKQISRQRKIVAKLEAEGLDTKIARGLLEAFEDVQVRSVAHRDRLREELGMGDK